MKGLNTLHPARGSQQKKKRLGRGNGSGIGSYSGKGIKGQKARSGNKGLTARSMRPYLLRIPKIRGFKAGAQGFTPINLSDLQEHFNTDELVTPKTLRIKGMITGSSARVKILSSGKLEKKLRVMAHAFSAEAKAAIEKAGGTAEILGSSRKALPAKKQMSDQASA